uniref:SHSP domain-containing protein n=1 Tax=Meloidogyne incognita TaxID=6306 RepID=A0A914KQ48_MELIC
MTENIKNEERNFYMGPVIFMDKQLKRLREAPVHIVISPERFQISIDLSIFEPEDIQLLLSRGQLVVLAEREVRINESSVVVRHFRRKISIPEDVVTDAVATQINS